MGKKRPIHVEVKPRHRDEPVERLIKRFTKKVKKFELQLVLCLNCWLVQTTKNIKREKSSFRLFFNFRYKEFLQTQS